MTDDEILTALLALNLERANASGPMATTKVVDIDEDD